MTDIELVKSLVEEAEGWNMGSMMPFVEVGKWQSEEYLEMLAII